MPPSPPPIEIPAGPPTEASLRALADALAQRERCEDTCCLGVVPSFVLGIAIDEGDVRYAEELRAIVDRAKDIRTRAIALRWLAQALDLRDVDRMTRLAGSAEPAGQFPVASYSQAAQMCYPIRWKPSTLGQVSLRALEAVTGAKFPDAAALSAWRKDNPDPIRSIAYWERVLGRRLPSPPSLLARLREADAELYAKVLLTASGVDPYGVGEPEMVRAARDILGPARLLRALGQEEVWPELAGNDDRLAGLALSVLSRADAIFDASHAPALLRLWEQGALRQYPVTRAALAVTASRLQPAERCRILAAAMDELKRGEPRVLEELARRCSTEKEALLREWFYAPRMKPHDAAKSAASILTGLRSLGIAARPVLKALVSAGQPIADDGAATTALVEAAVAAGCPDAFPRRDGIQPPMLKNLYAGEGGEGRLRAAQAEAAAARRDCVGRVLAWLSSR